MARWACGCCKLPSQSFSTCGFRLPGPGARGQPPAPLPSPHCALQPALLGASALAPCSCCSIHESGDSLGVSRALALHRGRTVRIPAPTSSPPPGRQERRVVCLLLCMWVYVPVYLCCVYALNCICACVFACVCVCIRLVTCVCCVYLYCEFVVLFVPGLCAVDALMFVYVSVSICMCAFSCVCVYATVSCVHQCVYLYLSMCMSVYICVSICVCVSVWTRGLRTPPVGGIWPGDVFGLAHRVFSTSRANI